MPPRPKTLHNAASIRAVADHLRQISTTLSVCAETMEREGIEQIELTHQAELERGLVAAQNFVNSATSSMHVELVRVGFWRKGGEPPKNKRRRSESSGDAVDPPPSKKNS